MLEGFRESEWTGKKTPNGKCKRGVDWNSRRNIRKNVRLKVQKVLSQKNQT
jgi:hypothetical protein